MAGMAGTAKNATIYHNPRCSTSRNTLKLIEEAGLEPTVVKYLETPPSRDGLRKLLDDAGLRPSEAIRKKEAVYKELGLASASEDELLDAMVDNPILIERPIVVTDRGTVLARPYEKVREIL
ncbi:arsenate reductase [Rhodococcus sp. Br-6]|jgi:arsenate reductase|nr:arsenate reductase [Rhodococcus sp. Br-6]